MRIECMQWILVSRTLALSLIAIALNSPLASAQYNEEGKTAPATASEGFLSPSATALTAFPDGLIGLSSTNPGVLYTIDATTGAAAQIVATNGAASITGLSYLGGTLYGSDLYYYPGAPGGLDIGSIDTGGFITFLSTQNGSYNWHGLASGEAAGRLWSIDLNNGDQLTEQFPDGSVNVIGGSGIDGRGMAYDDGNEILYALGRGSGVQSLYTVSTATGVATLIGSTGINSYLVGLAFEECSGTLYMTATVPGPGFDPSSLYTLGVSTGAATFVGATGFNAIDGLAWKGNCDFDGDGVVDTDDICPATVIPEGVPSTRLGVNRWALVDGDLEFDTTAPNGQGPGRSYSTTDTAGCSCEQIINALGLGKGHTKFGCSTGSMDNWVELVTP